MLAPITNSEPISAESQWIDSEDEEDEIDAILAEEKDYDPFTLAPSTLVSVKRIQTNWET